MGRSRLSLRIRGLGFESLQGRWQYKVRSRHNASHELSGSIDFFSQRRFPRGLSKVRARDAWHQKGAGVNPSCSHSSLDMCSRPSLGSSLGVVRMVSNPHMHR